MEGNKGSYCKDQGRGKELKIRTGNLEERNRDKIKVLSPPCLRNACISAYSVRRLPSLRLFLFSSSLPMLCLGHAIRKLATHMAEWEECSQRRSRRRPWGWKDSENRRAQCGS